VAQAKQQKKANDIKETAKRYVDEQLEILKESGGDVRVSKASYKTIVSQVARVAAKAAGRG